MAAAARRRSASQVLWRGRGGSAEGVKRREKRAEKRTEKDRRTAQERSDPVEPSVLDVLDAGKEEILAGQKSAGEGLGDVDPSLLVSRGNQIKTGEAKTQSEAADTANSELARIAA